MRKAEVQNRPGWVLVEVLEGDKVVGGWAVPEKPLFDLEGDDGR